MKMKTKQISKQAGKYKDNKIKSADSVRKCDEETIEEIYKTVPLWCKSFMLSLEKHKLVCSCYFYEMEKFEVLSLNLESHV